MREHTQLQLLAALWRFEPSLTARLKASLEHQLREAVLDNAIHRDASLQTEATQLRALLEALCTAQQTLPSAPEVPAMRAHAIRPTSHADVQTRDWLAATLRASAGQRRRVTAPMSVTIRAARLHRMGPTRYT